MNYGDIILIPCFKRPEFLMLCIEHILKTPEAKNLKVLFHVDFGYDKNILKVIKKYPYSKEIIFNEKHGFNKLPVNILRGYREAVKRTDGFVFMIEEDMIIANDFFKWHYAVQQAENLFCSIASKNNNLNQDLALGADLNKYYTSHITYQSLGVCFRKGVLEEQVLPHANLNYYKNNRGYCFNNFPRSRLKRQWCEQAGLIRRIQEVGEFPIAYPHVARAYHAGFYGKNRRGGSSFKGKYEELKKICLSKKQMRRYAQRPNYFKDSMPVALINESWQEMTKSRHYEN